MKLPKLVKESVARVKRAVKFNQPTHPSAIPEDVLKQKKFAELGYETDKTKIQNQLDGSGYNLDKGLSNNETKVFTNPATKEVTVAYRGTDLSKPSRWTDLRSDVVTNKRKHISKGWKTSTRKTGRWVDNYPSM